VDNTSEKNVNKQTKISSQKLQSSHRICKTAFQRLIIIVNSLDWSHSLIIKRDGHSKKISVEKKCQVTSDVEFHFSLATCRKEMFGKIFSLKLDCRNK